MMPYAKGAEGVAASTLVEGVLEVLTGGQGSEGARGWISACTRSGACNAACPEAVDPRLMLRLAKWRANETGVLPKREAAEAMSRAKAFARLGFSEREREEWL